MFLKGSIGGRPLYTFIPQVAHEQLQPDESKDTQTEHREDHDVRQLLHRLDQGPHDGLQACKENQREGLITANSTENSPTKKIS